MPENKDRREAIGDEIEGTGIKAGHRSFVKTGLSISSSGSEINPKNDDADKR